MLKRTIIIVTSGALFASNAWAVKVPKLSGKYALSSTVTCQSNPPTDAFGLIDAKVVIANFNVRSGEVSMVGAETQGELIVASGGNPGTSTSPVGVTDSFSNDATTLTLNGVTYAAVFGPLSNGVAQSVQFSGRPQNGCVLLGTGIHQ